MVKQKLHRVMTANGKWVHGAHKFGTEKRPRWQVLCRRVPRQHAFREVRNPIDCPHCMEKVDA